MFQKSWKGWKPLAIIWLLIISVLFFLPGSALPKENWLDAISFDKIVHFGLFAVLLFLWRFYKPAEKGYGLLFIITAILYGFAVELIQHYWVNNRSFDLGDVIGDVTGAVAGLWFWNWRYIKKIDPCRNRGRNQN